MYLVYFYRNKLKNRKKVREESQSEILQLQAMAIGPDPNFTVQRMIIS